MKFIINADDFGLSPEVNAGIVQAFELGLIDRTTAIANAPGFDDACWLARAHRLDDRVGVHFNLTDGIPLSSQLAHCPLFCRDGERLSFQRNATAWLSASDRHAVLAECDAQITRFHNRGLHPTHFDSHHHVHTEWSIFQAIKPVLLRYGISSVRMANNIARSPLWKSAYKRLFNSSLRRGKWTTIDYFGDCSEILKWGVSSLSPDSVVEVMIHPRINAQGVLIDALSGQALGQQVDALRHLQ